MKILKTWEGEILKQYLSGDIIIRTNEYCSYVEDADGVELISFFACDTTSDFDQPQKWDGNWDVVSSWICTQEEMINIERAELFNQLIGWIDVEKVLKLI